MDDAQIKAMQMVMDDATARERERCAKAVEQYGTRHGSSFHEYFSWKAFAAAIRNKE